MSQPPEGITIQQVSPAPDGFEVVLQSDAAKAQPGLKGNLIVHVFEKAPAASAKENATGTALRIAMDTLPPIPFEIVTP